jgi:HK97 family phage prohead protease
MTHDFFLKVKALEDSGTFTGFASTYGNTDLVGDVIAPGAFKQSIASQGSTGFPILWAHDQAAPVGVGRIADSAGGLLVNGTLVMADPAAVRAHAHLKAGSIKGLSIGFTIPEGAGKSEMRNDGSRLLKEIRLHEISLVAVPANPLAQVTSVKGVAAALTTLRGDDLRPDDRQALLRALKRLLGNDAVCNCQCPECMAGDCIECSYADCTDVNCAGGMNARAAVLAELQGLAAELRAH